MSNVYAHRPTRFFAQLHSNKTGNPAREAYCAGFEVEEWRCTALADHLIEWLADYALKEDELRVHHGNMYIRLKEAAIRIYTSNKYKKRGEIGEIVLHAICREFFGTIPFAPRVFYLTSSNDAGLNISGFFVVERPPQPSPRTVNDRSTAKGRGRGSNGFKTEKRCSESISPSVAPAAYSKIFRECRLAKPTAPALSLLVQPGASRNKRKQPSTTRSQSSAMVVPMRGNSVNHTG